jgi:DMSO/TMAO reductase YedYZ molybdopterin-dependent catalytic subunit
MKKQLLTVLVFLTLLFTVSCQQSVTPVTPGKTEPLPTPTTAAEVVLTLTGLKGETKDFTLADLKKLPSATGQAGIKSSTGKITPPALFKGVLMTELFNRLGGVDSTTGIQVEAKDGYAMTLSTDQVMTGNFIAYDPATGDETQSADKLQALIAYEMDGKPLDVERDGYLRLVVISSKNNQVTDGHWSIKWVRNITVKQLAREWNLALEGGIKDSIDRGSFESCSTAKCHPGTWKDEKAQTWSGTPLWIIAGRMDDAIKHGDNSFNKELAEKGYSVEVIGKDGYSVTFDIARLKGNANILLAHQVNGNPLPDADFPLRLVGSDVQKKEGVGGVQKIIIHFDQKPTPAPSATPTSVPVSSGPVKLPEGKAFMVNGLVEKQQAWTLDELKKLEIVKLTVEHPKSGPQAVEGVRINALLDLVKLKAEAKMVTFTAADGFTATSDVPALRACKDCLVAFNESGGLKLAMPGMGSGLWVKSIIAISIQ